MDTQTRAEQLVDSNTLDPMSHDTLVAWLNGDAGFQTAVEAILLEHSPVDNSSN